MKEMYPKVSIVIVNYNQTEVTLACLNSLRNVTYPNLEIFLVDNGSKPENRGHFTEFNEVRS
ncbi:MAG: glycosyltransferase [Bacteroidetes bacterium]|nr:glycosyltransferase [Bacteroidota bacterium]